MGLGRAIMTVLNLRDESNQKAPPRAAKRLGTPGAATREKIEKELSTLLLTASFVRHLYLAGSDGQLFGVAHASRAVTDPPADVRPALQLVAGINLGGELRRVFLEAENGITALLRIDGDRWLIVLCEKGASLGTVSVGIGKFYPRVTPAQENGNVAAAGAA